MRNAIKEFVEFSNQEKTDLWNNSTFVFDTNVLLNLYRYSNNTRNQLFDALNDLEDRIWIPYQVAFEFCKNRYKVIEESNKRFEKMKKGIDEFIGGLKSERLVENNDPDLESLEKYLNDWTEKKKDSYLVFDYTDDSVLNRVLELFEGKTGEKFSKDDIEKIEKEGKERYSNKIPPGYKDDNKFDNKFGDLIVWKEIIDYSKNNKNNIIFVVHDQKEDWWNKIGGKTIGPRPELRKEFFDETGMKFHTYTMTSFLSYFNEVKGNSIDKTTIDEVETIEEKEPNYFFFTFDTPKKRIKSREKLINEESIFENFGYDESDIQKEINLLKRKNQSRMNNISKLRQKQKIEGLTPDEETALKRNKERYQMDKQRIADFQNVILLNKSSRIKPLF